MKKGMVFGMVAVLATGAAVAQNDVIIVDQMGGGQTVGGNPSEVLATVEAALVSSHVWRGQVRNNDFVFQPQMTISQYGVSLNIWANYDLGSNYLGIQGDVSEMDFSLAYTLPIDISEVSFDIGLINYQYPANGDGLGSSANTGKNNRSTTELFVKGTVQSWKEYVIPSMTVFGDIGEADGVYVLFDVAAPYQISDVLWVEGGASAGWGNTSYNDYYFGDAVNGFSQDKGFNDFNFYGNASYEIMENLTASVNLTYTMLGGGSIADAGKRIYESGEKFWGGVNIAYDF